MIEPRGEHVTFVDGEGAEHVVVLARRPRLFAERRAKRKLERWKRQGRAFYVDPLEFVQVTRRR